MCDGYIWRYLAPDLARDYSLVHIQYPGHGRSPPCLTRSGLTISGLADSIAQVIREVGAEPIVSVGHSLGSLLALELWRRYPELIAGIVLLCGAPGRLVQGLVDNGRVLGWFVPAFEILRENLPSAASRILRHFPTPLLTWSALRLGEVNARFIRVSDLASYFQGLASVDLSSALQLLKSADCYDARGFLSEIDVPVLLMAGEHDRFTPPEYSEEMARAIPQSTLHVVRGATHTLPVEQPDWVRLKVRRFLERRF